MVSTQILPDDPLGKRGQCIYLGTCCIYQKQNHDSLRQRTPRPEWMAMGHTEQREGNPQMPHNWAGINTH